jgi:hypothetical protein
MVLFHEALECIDDEPVKRRKKNKVKRKKLRLSQVIESISGPNLQDNSLYPLQSASTISSERNIKKLLSPIENRGGRPSLKYLSQKLDVHTRKRFQNDLVVDLGVTNDYVMSTPVSSTKSMSDSIEGSISSRTSSRRVESVVRNLRLPTFDSYSDDSSVLTTPLVSRMSIKKKRSNLRSPPRKRRSAASTINTIKSNVFLSDAASKKQDTPTKKKLQGDSNVETVWI